MASSSSESEGEDDQEHDEEPLQRSEPSSPVKEEPEEEEDEEKEVIPNTPLNDQKTKRRGRKLVIIEFVTLTFFLFFHSVWQFVLLEFFT